MIKKKKKVCSECGNSTFIWKNDAGNKYCKRCWLLKSATAKKLKPTKRYSIPHRSIKRKKQDTLYTKLRTAFLTEHDHCQLHIAVLCSYNSTEVHHSYDGADREKYYLDTSTWFSACRKCHDWVHAHPKEAKELGFLK